MKVMNNPFNLYKPTVTEAKEICKSAGIKCKVVTSGYRRESTTVKPLGNVQGFINSLIEQKFYIVNGEILCS